jgi:hypothetical protein
MSSLSRLSNIASVTNYVCLRRGAGVCRQITATAFSPFQWARHSLLIAPLVWALGMLPLLTTDANGARGALVMVNRSVTQDQGTWVVDYRLRYTGKTGVIITSDEIAVKVEGWVSNSRVPGHALPRWSSLLVAHSPDLSAISDVVSATEEAHRCRERLVVSIWTDDQNSPTPRPGVTNSARIDAHEVPTDSLAEPVTTLPLSLGPAAIVRVRLRFEHQHILYGEYDPLLAMRSVMLTIGLASIGDVVPLDHEQYLAQPKFSWSEPPEDRRDTRHAISGPDSLHLEAHVPGHQYYRYVERPVRYSTQMRLRFWYLIAAGTEGDCKVRVAQCKETPVAWRMLNNGGFEQCLKTVGRWTKVERIIQTEAEATKLTLEFKIVGDTEVGEMWIDDVSLEPVGCDGPGGP